MRASRDCPECLGSGWLPGLGTTDWPEPEERCPYCRPYRAPRPPALPEPPASAPEPQGEPQGAAPGRLSERHPREQALGTPAPDLAAEVFAAFPQEEDPTWSEDWRG